MYANLPVNDIQDGHLSWDDESVRAHVKELTWAPWYEDEEGYLYIISDEVEGPDNEMAEAITRALHSGAHEEFLDGVVKELSYVDCVLRRFNPIDGFFHA